MNEILIRTMTSADAEEVAKIEEENFAMPWSRESFWQEIKNPQACFLVAVCEKKIVGYAGAWVVLDEAQLTNIAVQKNFQKKGIARALLTHLINSVKLRGADKMTLEVRPSNAPAIALYRSFRFENFGRRPRYYLDNGEDALIMWNLHLGEMK